MKNGRAACRIPRLRLCTISCFNAPYQKLLSVGHPAPLGSSRPTVGLQRRRCRDTVSFVRAFHGVLTWNTDHHNQPYVLQFLRTGQETQSRCAACIGTNNSTEPVRCRQKGAVIGWCKFHGETGDPGRMFLHFILTSKAGAPPTITTTTRIHFQRAGR